MSGTLQAGQDYIVPEIAINVALTTTDVTVGLDSEEVAEVQVKDAEKQRVLGFIPNFYASYVPDAAPLPSKLKFQLAWKSVSDPISILGAGFLAGNPTRPAISSTVMGKAQRETENVSARFTVTSSSERLSTAPSCPLSFIRTPATSIAARTRAVRA